MWVNLVDNEKMGEKKFGGSHAQGAGTNDGKGSLRSVCGYKNRVPADCGPELYTVIIVQCVATRAHAGTLVMQR